MAYTPQNFKDGDCLCAHHLHKMEDVLCLAPCVAKAAVGEVLVVKAIDENGKPTEWETIKISGAQGEPGVGIDKIEQTFTSPADDGMNVVTIYLTDGTEQTVTMKNGSKGNGIANITMQHYENDPDDDWHVRITTTDGQIYDFFGNDPDDAFDYAVKGGYEGTKEEFAEKLAGTKIKWEASIKDTTQTVEILKPMFVAADGSNLPLTYDDFNFVYEATVNYDGTAYSCEVEHTETKLGKIVQIKQDGIFNITVMDSNGIPVVSAEFADGVAAVMSITGEKHDVNKMPREFLPVEYIELGEVDDADETMAGLTEEGRYRFGYDGFIYTVEVQRPNEGNLGQRYWYTEEGYTYQYTRHGASVDGGVTWDMTDWDIPINYATANSLFASKSHLHYKTQTVASFSDWIDKFNDGEWRVTESGTEKRYIVEQYYYYPSSKVNLHYTQRYFEIHEPWKVYYRYGTAAPTSQSNVTWDEWKFAECNGTGGGDSNAFVPYENVEETIANEFSSSGGTIYTLYYDLVKNYEKIRVVVDGETYDCIPETGIDPDGSCWFKLGNGSPVYSQGEPFGVFGWGPGVTFSTLAFDVSGTHTVSFTGLKKEYNQLPEECLPDDILIKSPNGTKYKITVNDSGVLSAVALT